MRSQIAELQSTKSILDRDISNAEVNWRDNVEQSYHSNHIAPLQQAYSSINGAMQEVATIFEQEERKIEALLGR